MWKDISTGWETFCRGEFFEKDTGEQIEFSNFMEIDLDDLTKLSIDDFSNKYRVDKFDIRCDKGNCGNCISCNTSKEEYSDCTWFYNFSVVGCCK